MISIDCLTHKFSDVQAIIFDKDGTLEDSGDYLRNLAQKRARLIDAQIPGVGEPLLMAFGVNGLTLDPAGLQAVGSRYENEIAAAAYIAETGRGWSAALEIVRQAFTEVDRVMESTPNAMFPGCQKSIESFGAAGIKMGIISAATTSQVVNFANYHKLQSYFQVLLGSDLQFAKPDPRLFQFACQEMGVDPARTLMVGDSSWDMIMGNQGGAVGCVGISWRRSSQPLAMANVSISDLSELKIRM
ncbi:MAG: HAD family hydrolase [Chamaesiphon sp.]|nr:HAD family hydrolase [Chamaesiphon sp.]